MTARFIVADVFDGLASLEPDSVDLVVTSPPFLALRSYLPADHPDKGKEIGSERTPAEFLDVMLRFTAEVDRVLAPHGSLCVELGDTYAGSGGAGGDYDEDGLRAGQPRYKASDARKNTRLTMADGRTIQSAGIGNGEPRKGAGWPLAKSKTLIPELYRIALAYGINPLTGPPSPAGRWRIRNVVTWARPNPPVGALGDKWRPATSDIVVACRSEKRYWDDLATRRPHSAHSLRYYTEDADYWQRLQGRKGGQSYKPLMSKEERGDEGFRQQHPINPSGAPLLDYWEIPLDPNEEPRPYATGGKYHAKNDGNRTPLSGDRGGSAFETSPSGAPLLDYWVIPPTGYSGAHYAVYPPALISPLVQAMCPQRVCQTCGEPSRRIVEAARIAEDGRVIAEDFMASRQTTGWTDCGHDNYRVGRVLDPFAGSGTTLAVATGHGLDAIGFDLDARNAELALERVGPLMLEVVR